MTNLCFKYKPLYICELEYEYPKIIEYLNADSSFIVYGPKYCGKSTIVKLYLNYCNYDYLLIDDFNLPKDNIIEKIKYRTKSVFSYFNNKNFIIVIDNYDLFDKSVRDFIIKNLDKCPFLLISNKNIKIKINSVKIYEYSPDYILNLYNIIYFLENGHDLHSLHDLHNLHELYKFENINQMYSILEFNLKSKKLTFNNNNNNNNIYFDKFDYKFIDLVKEKKFIKKLYILDKIISYNVFHNNLIYNYNCIHELSNCYDNLSNSMKFLDDNLNSYYLDYYSILSIIGTSYNLNDFKIVKKNFQIRKNNNIKYY